MIVHKFGGTSVGDATRFVGVVRILEEQHQAPKEIPVEMIVVVSAMSGITNQLIEGARAAAAGQDNICHQIKAEILDRHLQIADTQISSAHERVNLSGFIDDRLHELERLYRSIAILGELTKRGTDSVAAFGEHLSHQILAAMLRENGIRSQAVSSTDLIVTTDQYGSATPRPALTHTKIRATLLPLIQRGVVPVVTGFIAATEDGITTTLGRGGSDYSAALIGAAMDADEVWIWTDVDGILSADPNIVPEARTIPELSYDEAADLAYAGANVLHPKTIQPGAEHGFPLRILNSFNPSCTGTRICQQPDGSWVMPPAIISMEGLSLIVIGNHSISWSLADSARVLQTLSDVGVEVLMFSQSLSEHCLNLVVREQDQTHVTAILKQHFSDQTGQLAIGLKERVAIISVVAFKQSRQNKYNGIAALAFSALGKSNTRVISVAQAAKENSVSFCVPEEGIQQTIRFLHHEFGHETQQSTAS